MKTRYSKVVFQDEDGLVKTCVDGCGSTVFMVSNKTNDSLVITAQRAENFLKSQNEILNNLSMRQKIVHAEKDIPEEDFKVKHDFLSKEDVAALQAKHSGNA